MKRLFAILLVSLFLVGTTSFAQTTIFKSGDRGKFTYTSSMDEKYPHFSIMHPVSGGEVGTVFGFITPETKITVTNKKISKADIDLLDGKEVLVTGVFKEVGSGEMRKTFCKELSITVVPESGRW